MQHLYRTQQTALDRATALHYGIQASMERKWLKSKYISFCHPNQHLITLRFGLLVPLVGIAKIPKERKFPCLDVY